MFHRMEMGRGSAVEVAVMERCHSCGFTLSASPIETIWGYDEHAQRLHIDLCRAITKQDGQAVNSDFMRVLHHLMHLMLSRYSTVNLRAHLCSELRVQDLVEVSERMHIETLPLVQRHHLVQLGVWLMGDLQERMGVAWRARALRYNHMEKGFVDPPCWYRDAVSRFRNWRLRL